MKRKQLYVFLASFILATSSCSVGTSHEHTYSSQWSYNDTYHWHAATCGHNVIINKEEHNFTEWEIDVEPTEVSDGHAFRTCEICQYTQETTVEPSGPIEEPDLIFVLNTDGLSYTVGGYNKEATSIEIPESLMGLPVTRIAENAFKNFNVLETITIPNSILELGKNAFLGCDSLTFNDIDNAHYLGNESNPYLIFHSLINTEVTEFSFKEGCRFGYGELNLTNDYKGAFGNVETLRIPKSMKYFFDGILEGKRSTTSFGKSNFKDIYYDGTLDEWVGVEFTDTSNNETRITFHFTDITSEENMSITLGNSVKSIGKYAFAGFSIDTLTLPNSIERIGQYAFKSGLGVYTPVVTNTNYLGTINEWAHIRFESDTSNPKSIYYSYIKFNGETVTEFVSDETMTEILPYTFRSFNDLKTVTLGSTITKVGKYAFSYATSIKTFSFTNSIKLFDESCFSQTFINTINYEGTVSDWLDVELRSSTSNIFSVSGFYPESFSDLDFIGCFKIGDYQFYKHKSINSVSNTSGIESVGMYAFSSSNITSISLPYVVNVYDHAFSNCASLTNVTLGEFTNYIGKYAFYKTAISSFTVPNLVTELREYTFSNCDSLKTFTFGSNVKKIYTHAVYSDLTQINYLGTLEDWCNIDFVRFISSYESCFKFQDYNSYSGEITLTIDGVDNIKNIVIPNTIETVNYLTFAGWKWVESVVIPSSVTSISLYAMGATNVSVTRYTNDINNVMSGSIGYDYQLFDGETLEEIKTIDITNELDDKPWDITSNNSVEVINIHCNIVRLERYYTHNISGCPNLKTINILDGVTDITTLEISVPSSVTINIGKDLETLPYYGSTNFGCNVNVDPQNPYYCSLNGSLYNKDKTEIISFYALQGSEWIVPDSLVKIRGGICSGNKNLTSVVLGNNVKEIEGKSFEGCTNLESITFNNSLIKIGDYTFKDCAKLDNIVLPDSVEEIGQWAFEGVKALKYGGTINCPANLKRMGFSNLLRSLEEENKRYWGDEDNPRRVLLWLYYRYFNDSSVTVTETTIDEGCEIIGDRAGLADSYTPVNIETINLPRTLKTIGAKAFYCFSNLENLNYNGTMEEWEAIAKYEDWYAQTALTVVHCLDGDVSLA